MNRRKALVTGANGFSGRCLVRYLQSQSVETTALSLRGNQLTDIALLAGILAKAEPDYIFHLAGAATAPSLEEHFRVNALYAAALLHAARESGLGDRPFLIVGTAAEYGQIAPGDFPITEETQCHPYDLYGITKLAQTHLGLAAAMSDAHSVIVARPFNIVGPGMPGHLALAAFQRQLEEIKKGERPPTLEVGNLNATRDFIDIDDVVRLYWALAQCNDARGQIFNLCTGIPTSLSTTLDLLIEASGLDVEIRSDETRLKKIDVPVHYGSNAKLKALLGDFDYIPLRTSIQRLAG